jgi:hypothetical protein
MIPTLLTQKADQASFRYGLFVESLRSLFQQSLASSRFGTPALVNEVYAEAIQLGLDFNAIEAEHFEADMNEIALQARTATLNEIESIDTHELTDAALEHLSESLDYLRSELLAQSSRDIATLRKGLQRVALEVNISARSHGRPQRSALMEYLVGNKAGIEFFFHDRASRKWESKTFVRSIWRHTLLSVYNEVVLFTLADHGITRAAVEHVSPGAEWRDFVIALSSGSELPTYSEIRDKIFHPNAYAYLRMETPDVSA